MNHLFLCFLRRIEIGVTVVLLIVSLIMTQAIAQNQIRTSLTVSQETLNYPYWLTVKTASPIEINGQIRLNNRVIHRFNSPFLRLNLTPYLKSGRYRLEIIGSYTPCDHNIEVSLTGQHTRIDQQMGGNGLINQMIELEVK